MSATDYFDELLDRTVVLGYSRLGLAVRQRLWPTPDAPADARNGTTVMVTGANSGIGKAIATQLATLGATVLMTVRD
ncbi:MAG: SDR family NAD(P)-dependent oxidoreductase, partial [Mycobacterium sp.]